jgi:hypothetical protein
MRGIALISMGKKLPESEQPLNVASRFARNKLAPWPTAVIDYLSGTNTVGEPSNLQFHLTTKEGALKTAKDNIAIRMLTPIVIQDFMHGAEDNGWTGVAKTLPVLAGSSQQTYDPNESKKNRRKK